MTVNGTSKTMKRGNNNRRKKCACCDSAKVHGVLLLSVYIPGNISGNMDRAESKLNWWHRNLPVLKRKRDRLLPWETREKCLFCVKRRQQMGKALDYLDVGSSSFFLLFFFFFLYSHTISMTATRRTLANCFISLYISVLVQNHCFFVRCITKAQLTQN